MAKTVPGRKEYVDDVSEQDKAAYAEWLKQQEHREDDGIGEGDTHFERWLKDKRSTERRDESDGSDAENKV